MKIPPIVGMTASANLRTSFIHLKLVHAVISAVGRDLLSTIKDSTALKKIPPIVGMTAKR